MPNTHETLTSLFSDIADAIRAKTGGTADIVADEFPSAISGIPQGKNSVITKYTFDRRMTVPETIAAMDYSVKLAKSFIAIFTVGTAVITSAGSYVIKNITFAQNAGAVSNGKDQYARASDNPVPPFSSVPDSVLAVIIMTTNENNNSMTVVNGKLATSSTTTSTLYMPGNELYVCEINDSLEADGE